MAWTYTSDPAGVPRDAVRWHLGDTDQARPLAQDEDIDFALGLDSNPRKAAAMVATSLAARFGRSAGITIDGISIDMSKRAEEFRALATRLNAEADGTGGGATAPVVAPVVTGATHSALAEAERDTDRLKLAVERDYPPTTFEPLP